MAYSFSMIQKDLWKKSYLLEIISNTGLVDAFTFSMPPESEEFTYSQRKTETKTFGGLWVDDYGSDATKIVLSGTTGNGEVKRIYRPGNKLGQDKYLTGEQEILYIRDNIIKYKDKNKADFGSLKMMLYDLSKVSSLNLLTGSIVSGNNYWQVFLGDFKMHRTKDKPFFYGYSIEFTGVTPSSETNLYNATRFSSNKDVLAVLNTMQTGLDYLSQAFVFSQNVVDAVTKVKDAISSFVDTYNSYVGYIAGIADNLASTIVETLGLGDFVYKQSQRIASVTNFAIVDIARDVDDSVSAFTKILEPLTDISVVSSSSSTVEPIPSDVLARYNVDGNTFRDTTRQILYDIQNGGASVVSFAKSSDTPTIGVMQDENGNDSVVVIYGSFTVRADSQTTLEQLSMKYLGSPDKALFVAEFNGLSSNEEILPGTTIKIPIFTQTASNPNNLIYALAEDIDQFGRDISLVDGVIQISVSGDFETIFGQSNMTQAIMLRLEENVTNRIRLTSYGLKSTVADPVAGTAYILSSLKETVLSDPRVSDIDNISFTGSGDSLSVGFTYMSMQNNMTFTGVI